MTQRWLVRLTAFLAAATLVTGSVTVATRLGDDGDPPLDVVTAAAERLEADETARIAFTFTSETGGQPFEMTGEGAIDVARNRFQMSVDGPLDARLHTVVIGLALYSGFEHGDTVRWVQVDMTFPGAVERGLTQDNVMPGDPARILEGLGDIGTVEPVGEELVRGVAAQRYHVTVTDPPEGQARTPDFDVWIAEGRIVRTGATLDSDGATARVRFELFDFGEPVAIEPPPEDLLVGRYTVEREEDFGAVTIEAQQKLTEGVFPFSGPAAPDGA